jgi:hypothetical protein
VDHSRALGHAADAHGAATEIGLQGDLFVDQVGGEDRLGRRAAALGAEGRHQGIEAR